jgi:hypothetical protein
MTHWLKSPRLFVAVVMLAATPAGAALTDRGGGLIYDDVLDITWLQDAGLGGARSWDDSVAWADALVYGGFDDWRVPSMSVSAGLPTGATGTPVVGSSATELQCRDNELAYLYYHNLGGTSGGGVGTSGPFINLKPKHWSSTEFSNPVGAWDFDFGSGVEEVFGKNAVERYAWAVHPGDIPEPATLSLLALGGLAMLRRKRVG